MKVANSNLASRTIAIINPNNGPIIDATTKAAFIICINYLRNAGVKVVGYVHSKTGWPGPINGYRSYSMVTADVDYWHNNYPIDGIFVEETSANWPQ